MINRVSPEKIYLQIAKAIEADLVDCYEPGDLYLSEKELTEKFGVNRHTVRRAVEELVKQDLLDKRHGVGTYVAERKMAYKINGFQRLSDAFKQNGQVLESNLLNKALIQASGSVAENLHLNKGEEVIKVDTLRKVEGKAVALISHYFPKEMCPEVFNEYVTGSLGEFLEDTCKIKTRRISSLASCVMPNASDSYLLGISGNQPILKLKTISEDKKTGSRIEYSVTRFRSNMIQLEIFSAE